MTRGGRREGAGRKPLPEMVSKIFRVRQEHLDALERYREQHGLRSGSEALRHLLESCPT